MGVMECDRKECNHIMCSRTINGTENYYICDDCYEELRLYLEIVFHDRPVDEFGRVEKGDVLKAIDDFMQTKSMALPKGKGRPLDVLDEITQKKGW